MRCTRADALPVHAVRFGDPVPVPARTCLPRGAGQRSREARRHVRLVRQQNVPWAGVLNGIRLARAVARLRLSS